MGRVTIAWSNLVDILIEYNANFDAEYLCKVAIDNVEYDSVKKLMKIVDHKKIFIYLSEKIIFMQCTSFVERDVCKIMRLFWSYGYFHKDLGEAVKYYPELFIKRCSSKNHELLGIDIELDNAIMQKRMIFNGNIKMFRPDIDIILDLY